MMNEYIQREYIIAEIARLELELNEYLNSYDGTDDAQFDATTDWYYNELADLYLML